MLIFKGQVRRYCQAFSKVVSEGEIMIFFGAGKVISFIKLVSRRKLFLILKKISQAIIVRRSRKKLLHYFRGRIVIIICWIMYVYHARQQTTYILQFWAQSIQTVRECKSYISCEIRHNYTIFDFGVQCRRINATPYDMGDPVWVGDGVVRWWVMGGLRGWGLLGGAFGPCPLRPAGTYRRRQTTDIIKPSRTFRNSYDATPEIFEAPHDIRFHSVCWLPLIDPIMGTI